MALTKQGIAEKVARRLVQRYSQARIAEKITYLAFLLADQPDKVQNPRGWLRRAIEEDYGPPDGFVTEEERARRTAEAAAQAQRDAALEQQQQALAAQLQTQKEEQKRHWQDRYGVSAADEQLWQEVCGEFRYSQPHLYQLFGRAYPLGCTDEALQLGFVEPTWLHQAQHPGALAALARALKAVVGRPLAIDLMLLPLEESEDPEGASLGS
ncbi:MAG TPA: hypothetical protein PKE45_00725 [Caldilineaceae bacterium]|nr:hypothetical protein [Caldilineaceae bacterium]